MQAGFYNKLEELQGENNTFYVGGLMAFELTERNAAYSVNLIAKHFATASENVRYVKVCSISSSYLITSLVSSKVTVTQKNP